LRRSEGDSPFAQPILGQRRNSRDSGPHRRQLGRADCRGAGTCVGHITAIDGTYRIAVPADSLRKTGNFTLHVEGLGFKPQSLKLSLSPDENVDVDFVLCPAPLKLTQITVSGRETRKTTITPATTATERAPRGPPPHPYSRLRLRA
jgi:hypothetical protein